MAVITTIQTRRGTLAQWTTANPVLAVGEMGYETDTTKAKFGDGVTAYLSLPYFTGGTGLSSTLNDGFVFVGNGANTATGVAVSGDLTAVNTGAFTVAKIQGTTVSAPTGTGAVVLATSPTLVTPALGTPSSATLTNATGLPISTGVSGLGANVATFLATPSSANLASAVTDETGTGALVFANSPTLVTPVLGTPTSGTLTNCTGLPVAGGGTGVATLTAYAPIFGGTTGTGAVQSGTVGTAGQVLTSNGAGSLPTFQTATGGAGGGTTTSSGTSITLTSGSTAGQNITMTAQGLLVNLPNATTLSKGASTFVIQAGAESNSFRVMDTANNLIDIVRAGEILTLSLVDNATSAGSWMVNKPVSSLSTNSFNINYSGTAPTAQSMAFTMLTPTKQIFVSYDNVTNDILQACIIDYTTSSFTVGAQFTIKDRTSATNWQFGEALVQRLDDSRAIIFYRDLDAGTLAAVAVSVSGTTITVGTAITVVSAASNPVQAMLLATDKVMLSSVDTASSTASGKLTIVTASSLTLTAGTTAAITTSAAGLWAPQFDMLVANSSAIVLLTRSTATQGRAVVASISGSTITINTVLNTATSATIGIANGGKLTAAMVCASLHKASSTRAYVIYPNSTATGRMNVAILDISGTTVTTPGGDIGFGRSQTAVAITYSGGIKVKDTTTIACFTGGDQPDVGPYMFRFYQEGFTARFIGITATTGFAYNGVEEMNISSTASELLVNYIAYNQSRSAVYNNEQFFIDPSNFGTPTPALFFGKQN